MLLLVSNCGSAGGGSRLLAAVPKISTPGLIQELIRAAIKRSIHEGLFEQPLISYSDERKPHPRRGEMLKMTLIGPYYPRTMTQSVALFTSFFTSLYFCSIDDIVG